MNREFIENETMFFEYLNAAVIAYKKLDEEQDSFYNSVRKNSNAPLLRNMTGSDVLLSKTILSIALARRGLVTILREQSDYIKFSDIENEEKFIKIKNEIFKDDINLSNAECGKILTQICNAIAHGDIIQSFDIKKFTERLYKVYSQCGSVESSKNPTLQNEVSKIINECSSLIFNYDSHFIFTEDGQRIKRPAPVKKQLQLSLSNMFSLFIDILNNDYIKHHPIAFFFDKEGRMGSNDNVDGVQFFELDNVQEEQLKGIEKECLEFLKSYKTNGFTLTDIYNNMQHSIAIKNEKDEIVPAPIDYMAKMIALQRVLLDKKFKYFKVRNIQSLGCSMPRSVKNSKRDKNEYLNDMLRLNFKIFNYSDAEFLRSCYANMNLNDVHKEMLVTQVLTMLEIIEQNNLKTDIGNSAVIEKIAKEVFEVNSDSLSNKEKLKIVDHIRNALVHGNYINGADDEFEIYDQKSASDNSLEYKFTLYTEDLEEIKDVCLETFRELKKSLTTSENKMEK